jgi:hypothetical protein
MGFDKKTKTDKKAGQMIKPNFTCRVRNYVQRSPQCKNLLDFEKERLIKGMARMVNRAYIDGFVLGTSHPKGCNCSDCVDIGKIN